MTQTFANRVKERSTSSGTGAFTLDATTVHEFGFTASLTDGDLVYYSAEDRYAGGTDKEVGIGTWDEATETLARTTILRSSNSDAVVDFSNAPDVWVDAAAEWFAGIEPLSDILAAQLDTPAQYQIVTFDGSGNPVADSDIRASGLGSAVGKLIVSSDSLGGTLYLLESDTQDDGGVGFRFAYDGSNNRLDIIGRNALSTDTWATFLRSTGLLGLGTTTPDVLVDIRREDRNVGDMRLSAHAEAIAVPTFYAQGASSRGAEMHCFRAATGHNYIDISSAEPNGFNQSHIRFFTVSGASSSILRCRVDHTGEWVMLFGAQIADGQVLRSEDGSGTDAAGGTLALEGGDSTGDGGSTFTLAVARSGQGSGSTARTAENVLTVSKDTPSAARARIAIADLPAAAAAATELYYDDSAAYAADDESSAYAGIDNAQGGSVYATVADVNALRTAYENLRAFVEDLLGTTGGERFIKQGT